MSTSERKTTAEHLPQVSELAVTALRGNQGVETMLYCARLKHLREMGLHDGMPGADAMRKSKASNDTQWWLKELERKGINLVYDGDLNDAEANGLVVRRTK